MLGSWFLKNSRCGDTATVNDGARSGLQCLPDQNYAPARLREAARYLLDRKDATDDCLAPFQCQDGSEPWPKSRSCVSVQPFFISLPSGRNKSMLSPEFWSWFGDIASPKLAHRTETFRKIFTYLDRFERPIGIVETGCVRQRDNWAGDGQSTILFDKYSESHSGSVVFSVDRDPQATALCRSLVSDRVRIHTDDSIAWLKSLTDDPPAELRYVDLLYLDSYDVDFDDPLPSAIHHLKELVAIAPLLSAGTLVAVDDSPSSFVGVHNPDNSFNLLRPPKIDGKGRLIAEYAAQIGAEVLFVDYQCAWLRIGRRDEQRADPMQMSDKRKRKGGTSQCRRRTS